MRRQRPRTRISEVNRVAALKFRRGRGVPYSAREGLERARGTEVTNAAAEPEPEPVGRPLATADASSRVRACRAPCAGRSSLPRSSA